MIKNKKEVEQKISIIFFDFKKAYDIVSRNLLASKFQKFNTPWNIIKLNILNKFTLIYEGKNQERIRISLRSNIITPTFWICINELMRAFIINEIEARAYADDIVCF